MRQRPEKGIPKSASGMIFSGDVKDTDQPAQRSLFCQQGPLKCWNLEEQGQMARIGIL